jgi:hypothetical protein
MVSMSQPPRDSQHALSGPGHNSKRSDYREHRLGEPLHRNSTTVTDLAPHTVSLMPPPNALEGISKHERSIQGGSQGTYDHTVAGV